MTMHLSCLKVQREENMMKSKLIKGVVISTAVFAFALPAVSTASDLKGRAEKVSYSDLDLQKDDGLHALYRRLQLASKRVCGVESLRVVGNVRTLSNQRKCYAESLDEAVAEVNNPRLTALHNS